jgi:hypothetical protein
MMMWILIELWKLLKENIKIATKESLGCYELKQLKPWSDGCLQLLGHRKQAKLK